MNSTQTLNRILEELKFTKGEQEGFAQAVQVAKDYIQNGKVDMEKEYRTIVEKVVRNEI